MTNTQHSLDDLEKICKQLWNNGYNTAKAKDFNNLSVPEATQALQQLIDNRIADELETLQTEMSQVLDQPALGDVALYTDLRIIHLRKSKGGESE